MAKKLFKKITAAALTAIGVTALGVGASGCARKSSASFVEPENAVIARLTPPDDGSLPTAHTCAENLAYLAYVFDGQTQYHSYSYGVTGASIATQTTRTFRDYKDGVLLTTDFTHSSMIKNGSQTCTLKNDDGDYEVYFRTSEAPDANTLPAQAVWSEEAPLIFNERSYHFTYGLLPTELFNYIINPETIVDSEEVKVNPDGTYTQSFVLDPVASTYYYQFGMKTRGGLSGYPEFKSISFSVTFDAEWKILSSYMHEVASVNKGVVVESVSDFTTEYWYGEDHFDNDHYSYLDGYYKKFIGDEKLEQGGSVEDKLVVDVTSVLSNGFAEILNGGDQFEVSADLGKNHYAGYVYLSLDLSDPLASLALKLSLGKRLNASDLFVEYGNGELSAYYGKDFALKANLAEVKLVTDGFGDVIKRFETAIGKITGATARGEAVAMAEASAQESDPVAELMNAMELVYGEKQAVLTLKTDDLLGMGIGINARLVFAIDGNKITFRGATVKDIAIGGEKLDLSLALRATTAPEINRVPSQTGANIADYIADVHSLLGADLIKVGIKLDGFDEAVKIKALKGIGADVTVYADVDGLTLGADADVSYVYNGNKISAKLSVWYGYDPADANYGEAVVCLTELNGAPYDVRLKCDVKQLADAISSAVTLAGADLGGGTDGLVNIINGALSSDLSKVLTEVYADKTRIKMGVSVDALLNMLNLDLGVKFGNCTLKYERGEGVYGGELSASLPALGLALSVQGEQGEVTKPDVTDALDISYVLEDIKGIAQADLLQLKLTLDGSAKGVTVPQLKGIEADVNACFTTENVAVSADAEVSYTYGKDKVSARVSAYYGGDEVAISLNAINGVALNAGVTCNISEITQAVQSLIEYAGLTSSPFGDNGGLPRLSDAISKILTADFAKLLPVLGTTADGLAAGVDLDEVLSLFGVNAGVKLGTVSLLYSHTADDVLSVALPALGLRASLNGSQGGIVKPDAQGYLDLTSLVKVVEKAWRSVDGIIGGQAVAFEIAKQDSYLSLDGILVQVWGNGEVSWKKGEEYVALDIGFGIKEDENQPDDACFKLIYNKNADGDTPLVRLALNEIGLDIYREDIDDTVNGFNGILDKIKPLLGGSAPAVLTSADGGEAAASTSTDGGASANDRLFGLVFGLLARRDWVNVLNDFTVSCDGGSLALNYLQDNCVSISVGDGGDLSLFYKGATDGGFSLGGSLTVSAPRGSIVKALSENIDATCKVTSTKNGIASFIRLAYDFLFDGINAVSVENILGSKTYEVKFKLDGTDTGVKELEDVYIDVGLYHTNAGSDHGRLAEINLDISVKGVVVNLNVICEYVGRQVYFYMNLKQVMDITLPDLKFVATQDSLYDTLKVIFDTVNDTDVIGFAGKILGLGGTDSANTYGADAKGAPVADEGTVNKICDIVEKLLAFNFNDAFVATENDGVITAKLHIDSVLKQLGIDGGGNLEDVDFEINRNTHFMKTSGVVNKTDTEGKTQEVTWIYLSSERAERKSYEGFRKNEYVSIEFLPDLLNDAVNFATRENEDGSKEIYDKFTLSGRIKADLSLWIINETLNVDVRSLTIALGENGDISLSGVLHFNKFEINVLVAKVSIPDTTVGITYKNGLITLAKGVTTATPEYKVMTFNYFIDHLLVKNGSVLQWWLDISGWEGVFNILDMQIVQNLMGGPLKITSGIENTEDVYLYERKQELSLQDIYMKDFVEAIRVVIGGTTKTNYVSDARYAERMDAVEGKLGIQGKDYYGFSLNAGRITGNVFNDLYAAILRTEDKGITNVLAQGSIKNGMVNLDVNLGYNEGLTEEYAQDGNDNMTETKCAPDFYGSATGVADKLKVKYDFKYYKQRDKEATDESFGCLTVSEKENYANGVDYSYPRHFVDLTVKELDGTERLIKVKQGSDVYLYDNEYPAFTDDGKQFRLLYSLTENEVGGKSFTMNGATTVYAVRRTAVTVKFLKLDGTEYGESVKDEYSTFVGDAMPLSASGMEAVDGPYYADGTKVQATDRVPEGSVRITLYGTFARTLVTEKGVEYAFNKDTQTYAVKGRSASGFNEDYVDGRKTIYLESHIDGYPVTEIGERAFANTELNADANNVGKPIASIVVPATVTKVGKNAFLDNVGMEYAVFLADNVVMDCGSAGNDNDSKDQPFYGCSSGINGNSTNLAIYYNGVTCGDSTDNGIWTKMRVMKSGIMTYRHYIGCTPESGFGSGNGKNAGGALHKGGWEYAKVAVNNACEEISETVEELVKANLTDGLHEGVNDAVSAQKNIQNALDEKTAVENGYIDKYAVAVAVGKDAYGYTVYTVTVTPARPKYAVTVAENNNAVTEITGAEVKEFDGKKYASGEITVTCKDLAYGYNFTGFTVNGVAYAQNPATVNVTEGILITVSLKANLYDVKLVSAVGFTYGGQSHSAGETTVQLAEVGNKLSLGAPVAEGYTFLGWAREVYGALEFTSTEFAPENGATFYAVWGQSKVGEAFTISQATSGATLPSVSGGLNKWFDGSWNEVTRLSKENTVVYTRSQFTLNYALEGNSLLSITDSYYNTTKNMTGSYSNKITVLEGQRVSANNTGKKEGTIYVDGVATVKLTMSSRIYNIKSLNYSDGSVSSDINIKFMY